MSAPVTRLTSVIESIWQVDRRVGLADRVLVRAGHEAEGFAVLQIHMRGMPENVELLGGLLQRIEIGEELLFGEHLAGKLPLVLSWVSMKYFTVSPLPK